jgi:hypothetical protein
LGRFEDTQNRAIEQAALSATLAGGAEESRIVQTILSMLGYAQPAMPQFVNTPQITVPFPQEQQGANPLSGLLALGGLGAGAALGGPAGASLGFQAGGSAPLLFGG